MRTFWGYRRPDGAVGVRNHLAIIPSVVCANTVAQRIAQLVPGAVALPHPHGCAQIGDDVNVTERTLAGAAANPNVAAALIVGLGCETCQANDVAHLASQLAPGKLIESMYIQEAGGSIKAIQKGVEAAKELARRTNLLEREEVPLSELVLATECGGSDATSGMAANPVLGVVSDLVVAEGGTAILSETTELMGAEHILARRARDQRVAERIFEIVAAVEAEAQHVGATVAGGNPTPGNIAGGLTTIEEKSLGCIYKAGTSTIMEVVPYATRPTHKGLVIMDTPGQDAVSVTGMVCGGTQVCIFTTGRGSPLGNAIAPVIKITANPQTARRMEDNIDFSAAPIVEGTGEKESLGRALFELLIEVCSGQLTCAEIIGHQEFALHRVGPTV